jgi:hypothetical protein
VKKRKLTVRPISMGDPVNNWPVRKEHCLSCPFRPDPATGREQNPVLVARVIERILGASQQCHHPGLSGRQEFQLCRGARNWQLTFFYRLGFLKAPTDEAWEERRKNLC